MFGRKVALKGHSPFLLASEMICYTNIYGVKGFILENMSLKYEVMMLQ